MNMPERNPGAVVGERHDVVILFDVQNGNPNGDPDTGNMPRTDPYSMRGLVSDVCLKRKVRNHVAQFGPRPVKTADGRELGYEIHVREGNVLKEDIDQAYEQEMGKKPPKDVKDRREQEKTFERLCRSYYDIRTFGAVLSTEGPLKGSFYGQVRGPVQFTFGQSLDKIMTLDVSITRCAVASEKERTTSGEGEERRTMGRKHIIPYALYRAHAYLSPAFARRTGFCYADLDVLFRALGTLFEHDRSAARGEMRIREVLDFEHVGAGTNAEERSASALLGCAPSHRLLEKVGVVKKFEGEFPSRFEDYQVMLDGKALSEVRFPVERPLGHEGVVLHRRV